MEPSKTGVLKNISIVFTSWSKYPLNKPSTVISTHPSGHASFRNGLQLVVSTEFRSSNKGLAPRTDFDYLV